MEIHFTYNKKKVIQALRLHFIAQKEIKILMILVNVFAIVSAILYYNGVVRPEPFFLGTTVWLLMLLGVWYILPYSIYKKSSTFKDNFTAYINNNSLRLDNNKGNIVWTWNLFEHFFESPFFFHLYFNKKSFFLIPKDGLGDAVLHDIRAVLNDNVKRK